MKKVIALIFALALLVCLAPAVFAATENAAVDASNFFAFTNESHGLTADTSFNKALHTLDTHVEGVCDPWAFVNLRTGSNYGTTETSFFWQFNVGDYFPRYAPGVSNTGYTGAAIAFELVFDTAGTFNPVVTYIPATSSPKVDFYLVDKTKETEQWYAELKESGTYQLNDSYFYSKRVNGLSSADYLGTIDMYGAEAAVDTATFPAREVKAQSYYLVVIPNGYNESMTKIEDGTAKYLTLKIKSFAMAARPELTSDDTLTYNTQVNNVINVTMLPAHSSSGSSYTLNGVTINCMRGSNMLHYIPFASWKATYNYKAQTDENGNKITTTDDSGKYTVSAVEECESYNTMLLTNTDPWLIEGGEIPQCHSSSVSAYHTTGTFKTNGYADTARPRLTLRVNVPHAGKYNISMCHNNTSTPDIGAAVEVFFGKAPEKTLTAALHSDYLASYQNLGWFKCNDSSLTSYTSFGVVDVPVAGEYIISFYPNAELSLSEEYGNPTKYETGTYASKPYQVFSLKGVKLTPVADTELESVQAAHDAIASANDALISYEEEAGVAKSKTTVNAFAAYIDGTELEADIIDISSADVGSSEFEVSAPEREGYTFLYWAKAATSEKMIVSRDATYKFVPHTDAVNLIAVYEKSGEAAAAKAEFYNANGVLVATLTEDGAAPSLPNMAGFDDATHWALYGSDDEYAAGDAITLDGTMIFVASYGDKKKVNITVSGGTVSDANPEYGDVVTATATEREGGAGAKVFNYWERDGKVVSYDTTYTFKAWNDTELTAVYKDYKPELSKEFRKIVLGTFTVGDETAIMAEFIGLEDAVEKGIMFGDTKRAPMTTNDTQFSIINNLDLDAVGYAILSDGTIITDK